MWFVTSVWTPVNSILSTCNRRSLQQKFLALVPMCIYKQFQAIPLAHTCVRIMRAWMRSCAWVRVLFLYCCYCLLLLLTVCCYWLPVTGYLLLLAVYHGIVLAIPWVTVTVVICWHCLGWRLAGLYIYQASTPRQYQPLPVPSPILICAFLVYLVCIWFVSGLE